ncbi:hypothetical protein SM11_pC1297 (plasmid) [Sinorhizobium meliloti SM11]|uniref:Uncharacterized protein n=1 Tax=Sinorhizobium meliloti (strain SM11) TaxID=707241 RepID=F7XFQ0_SINMM|nr:hypothetical protein SM11_pC1297 [Sinorhizobium meliloti SM11]
MHSRRWLLLIVILPMIAFIVQCAANQGLHDPRRRTGSEAIDSSALGPLAS